MIVRAARVEVLAIDQLADRARPVTRHRRRFATRCRDDLAIDHENAVVAAGGKLLDNDRTPLFAGGTIRGNHLLSGSQVNGDTPPLVAILRFDHDRHADLNRGVPGFVFVVDRLAFGDRDTGRAKQLFRQFFVLRDVFGDRAGVVRFSGDDAADLRPIAKLNEAAFIEAPDGNATLLGSRHDRGGAGAEADFMSERPQRVDFRRNVERLIVDRGDDQSESGLQRGAAELFLAVADHHLVDALFGRLAGLAVADGRSGQCLEFERGVLEDVTQPGPFPHPLKEPAPLAVRAAMLDHRGEPGDKAVDKPGQRVGRAVLELLQVDQCFENWVIRPNVGTP